MKIKEVLCALEKFAPLPLQESWDNAGLQIGLTETEVSGALLCLDVNERIIDEAVKKGCNLVVSHHPLLFRGLKTISDLTDVQRTVRKAIQQDICVISMHTNMDNAKGGVNFRIAQKLGLQDVKFFASKMVDGVEAGSGVIGTLPEAMASDDFVIEVKKTFEVECARCNQLLQRPVKRVAICGGAGDFLLDDAVKAGADAFITGEMHYHQYFGYEQKIQICVIGHYESEQFTAEVFQEIITQQCPGVKKRALRGELPLEVQDLEDEIAGLTTRVEKIQNEISEFQRAITQKKGEIVEAEASVARYKSQLDEVKNNREYDTLSKEIEFQTLEIELCNKKIREANARIQEKKSELQANEEVIKERQGDLEMKKSELEEIMTETRAEEEKLKEKVKDLESKIETRLLTSFKRIRKNARNGLGIVYVQRDACGGCFNKIPPQRQLDIKMHKKIIVCEYCGRIMIDPELAGVKIDKVVTEEKKTTRKRAIRKTASSKRTTDASDMD